MQTDANQNSIQSPVHNSRSSVTRAMTLSLRSSAVDAVADFLTGSWAPPADEIRRVSPLPVADDDYETAVSMTLNFYHYLWETDSDLPYDDPHFGIGPERFEIKSISRMSDNALGSISLDFVVDLTPGKLVAAFEAIGSRCRTALIGTMAFAMDIRRHGPTTENKAGFCFFMEMLATLLHEHFAIKH